MFSFTEEQDRKFVEWLEKHEQICPYVQHGRTSTLTYSFTPLPDVVHVAHAKVHCGCGGHIDLGVE
jgi:hypothetical protein